MEGLISHILAEAKERCFRVWTDTAWVPFPSHEVDAWFATIKKSAMSLVAQTGEQQHEKNLHSLLVAGGGGVGEHAVASSAVSCSY